MAHSKINLKNPIIGTSKSAPVGFSWTTFFFGPFPALFRGDIKWAAIIFFASVLVGIFTSGIGVIVTAIVFGFVYNKNYISDLVAKGYIVDNIESSYDIHQIQQQIEVVLVQDVKNKAAEPVSNIGSEETKKCPYCAEDVKKAAVICKHCGKDITEKPSTVDFEKQLKSAIMEKNINKVRDLLKNNEVSWAACDKASILNYAEIYYDKLIMDFLHQKNNFK